MNDLEAKTMKRSARGLYGVVVAIAIFAVVAGAAEKAKTKAARTAPRRVDPAMVEVTDDPKLPRVLLIGDSISIGYTPAVRKMLAGKANVHRPLANCGSTSVGMASLEKWLGKGKWDVIHFNFGLHDLSYIYPATGLQQDAQGRFATLGTGRHKVPPELYEKNLRELVTRLKKTGARLIWATTTPVPGTFRAYVKGDDAEYNPIATRVMKENGIAIDDLGAFARPQLEKIQIRDNVHFTAQGSEVLAGQVVRCIEAAL
jgi:acyl-CoA thioesterase-1